MIENRRYFWLLLVLVFAAPTVANACFAPPPYLSESHHELVLKSQAIVLAKAVKTENDSISGYADFIFEPVEVLKGDPPSRIELHGLKAGPYVAEEWNIDGGDYEGHRSPEFWAWSLGNGAMDTACHVSGVFEVGQTYLIFLRDKPHFRAYENIRREDDLWLAVVRLVAENLGDFDYIEDRSFVPQAGSLSECIEKDVADETLIYVRHTAIDVCIERHGIE